MFKKLEHEINLPQSENLYLNKNLFLVINFLRDTWINFLEKRFPDLEFVKKTSLRSVVDTHRNMGIITVLLTVKGCCDPFLIKKRLVITREYLFFNILTSCYQNTFN